jgi:hypothetical protein
MKHGPVFLRVSYAMGAQWRCTLPVVPINAIAVLLLSFYQTRGNFTLIEP